MIVVKLIGGLGNQMYQYAYGLQLAKTYHEQICFDTSFYPKDKPLALYNLMIPQYPLWVDTGIPRWERYRVKILQKIFHVLQKVIRVLGRTDRTGDLLYQRFAKHGMMFNFDPYYYEIARCEKNNKYIYGYFQGQKYFSECEEQIKQQFNVRAPLSEHAKHIEKQIEETNAVALHIRLGDYTNAANTDLNVCSNAYYDNAISYIGEVLQDPVFFVFTNDGQRVLEMFKFPKNTILVQGTKDYEDFALMKKCKHFVSSNSTFSWWASYLAENPEKIVTVPEKWRHSEKNEPAIYMEYMVKLPIV